MCWGVPAKVVALEGLLAKVDFGDGALREALVASDEIKVGDLVLVHAGTVISRINIDEVLTLFDYLRQMTIEDAKEKGLEVEEVGRSFDEVVKALLQSWGWEKAWARRRL